MIPNIKIFLLCPIPEDQKPINEYIDFKENTFFNWTTWETTKYQAKLISFYSFVCFLTSLFQGNLWEKNLLKALFASLALGSSCVFVFLGFAFLRWREIKKRFNEARLFYEEASWFDGQIWEKPFFLIKNDKLICTQKIEPILQRLIRGILSFTFLALFFFSLFATL
jgi:hypothetical protein